MALWQVRATVVDKPGFLAVLAASLALRSVNILSVGVHVTEAGAVDDFLVDAPDQLTEAQLLAAVERGRGRDAWVARAEARNLVDAPTRAIDLATHLVRDPAAVGEALAELLDARVSWQPVPVEPWDGRYGAVGGRMRVPAPGGAAWLVERPVPDFTPAEYARAQALLAVATAAGERAGAGGSVTTDPATLLLPGGDELILRRGDAADLPAVRAMHSRCSPESLHRRYLSGTAGPPDPQLTRLLAPARGCALVVEAPAPALDQPDRIVAMANLVGEGVQAELALLTEDAWQRRGIGTALLRRAVGAAASAGFEALVVHTQAQNTGMLQALRRLDGPRRTDTDGGLLTVTVQLGAVRHVHRV
ncbi:MAG: GNAT family N-acetyltransferase [Micromonosporaceae bacterium]|nr:GNAT family N-acetyltransferase [Micromonosporaceae bacterium]